MLGLKLIHVSKRGPCCVRVCLFAQVSPDIREPYDATAQVGTAHPAHDDRLLLLHNLLFGRHDDLQPESLRLTHWPLGDFNDILDE